MKQKTLIEQATQAFCVAVGKVIEQRRRSGEPVAVWRNGAAQWVYPESKMALGEKKAVYSTRRRPMPSTGPLKKRTS